ncbi:MAG: hypothetical protein KBD37_05400 [Burkholderiales bacterium]|nr:hypothetical protein [Burkholderiales bacterium]
MKKIAIVMSSHLKNGIFSSEKPYDFDNFLFQHRLLKDRLSQFGYDLVTYDINNPNDSDVLFYYGSNESLPEPSLAKTNFLFLWESKLISPQIYDLRLHQKFKKIFTFCDDIVDNKKYFKINYAYLIPTEISKDMTCKQKLCTLIADNKMVNHPLELYSKRIDAIRWFENHHQDEFDLYGRGWCISSSLLLRRVCNRLPVLRKILSKLLPKSYPSYRGELAEKIPILEKYKFAICYENARDIPGYITEKIFHCFFAGCVPIYWGANNIKDYVPESCFIDKRKYDTYEELYEYISKMPDVEYLNYLTNIEEYLNSDQIQQLSAQNFADTVIKEVLNEK